MAASINMHVLKSVKICKLCIRNRIDNVIARSYFRRWKHNAKMSKIDPDQSHDTSGTVNDQARSGSKQFPKYISLDPRIAKEMEEADIKARHHPGVMTMNVITVPEQLEAAALILCESNGGKALKKPSEKLVRYLNARHPPVDFHELRSRAKEMEQETIEKENLDVSNLSEKKIEALKKKIINNLKYTTYSWQPIKYDKLKGMTYMVGRLAQNYSVLLKCLTEIKKRDPRFFPGYMYNFGSGLGTAIWAVNKIWEQNVLEYFCVDQSNDMNEIARLLLQDGDEEKKMCVKGVYLRQYEPAMTGNQFPLVISAYTLLEQPSSETRKKLVRSLWQRTTNYLVLIENGTYAGHRMIQEARELILEISQQSEDVNDQGHVFAPCPHDNVCPKFQWSGKVPCTFEVKYMPLGIVSKPARSATELYTYVIMRKKWDAVNEERRWPRFIMPIIPASRHTHCKLCCPDGQYHNMIMTTSKTPNNLYRVARKSSWGDLLPVVWPDKLEEEDKSKPTPRQIKRMRYLKKREEDLMSDFIDNVTQSSRNLRDNLDVNADANSDNCDDDLNFVHDENFENLNEEEVFEDMSGDQDNVNSNQNILSDISNDQILIEQEYGEAVHSSSSSNDVNETKHECDSSENSNSGSSTSPSCDNTDNIPNSNSSATNDSFQDGINTKTDK